MNYRSQDLSAYVLPGRAVDPKAAVGQARAAEALGLGGIWCSERWETKEIGSLCGVLCQATSTIRFGTAVTHFGTRHPVVLAGLGSSLQFLSGGRFVMGFGRSVASLWPALGLPPVTLSSMADYATILRRLWKGEEVSYEGPAGRYPRMQMAQLPDPPPPIGLAAIGPKTLALAGSHFDAVFLHPFLTTEAVQESAAIVRRSAEISGRDPASVTVYAAVVVAPDLSTEERASALDARAVSYFVHADLGGAIVKANRWDMAPLSRILGENLGMLERQQLNNTEIRARVAEVAQLLPPRWLSDGAAVGTAKRCAERLRGYRLAGADGLLLHGTTPDRLQALVGEYVTAS